jgi:hypothetical protein
MSVQIASPGIIAASRRRTAAGPTWFGNTSVPNAVNFSQNFVYFFPAVCTANGNLTAMQIYVAVTSVSGAVKLAVYANSAGAPGSLLGETAAIAITATGWQQAAIVTPFAVTNGTTYHLARLSTDPAGTGRYGSLGSGSFALLASTYPTFPGSGAGNSPSSGQTAGLQAGVT